jgi:hypothetical protein
MFSLKMLLQAGSLRAAAGEHVLSPQLHVAWAACFLLQSLCSVPDDREKSGPCPCYRPDDWRRTHVVLRDVTMSTAQTL